jgi:hypothetical protein
VSDVTERSGLKLRPYVRAFVFRKLSDTLSWHVRRLCIAFRRPAVAIGIRILNIRILIYFPLATGAHLELS